MLCTGASRKRVRHSFARSVVLRPSVPRFHPSSAVAPRELFIVEPAPWDRSRDADMAQMPVAIQPRGATMRGEFMAFLKQYGVIGLAIAVIIGGKANALVTALVDGVLMPLVTFFLPGGAWRTAMLNLGPIHLLLGPLFGAAVDFLIVAWLVFLFAKHALGEETVTKK